MLDEKMLDALSIAQEAKITPRQSHPDVKATPLDALSKAFRRDEIVVTFQNPDPDGEDINIILEPLEPGEQFEILDSLLSSNVAEALQEGEINEETAVEDTQSLLKQYEQALDVLQRCIKEPVGITLEILRGWDEAYIFKLFSALVVESRASSPAARFPEKDNGSPS